MTLISKFLSEEKAEAHAAEMRRSGYVCNVERTYDVHPKRKVWYVFATELKHAENRSGLRHPP